jgi:peptide deformylase
LTPKASNSGRDREQVVRLTARKHGAFRRPQSGPYVLVWALPASLDCLVSERPDGNVLTIAATTLEDMAEQGQVKTDELDAQEDAKRRLALAQIRQYPDPVLRLEAQEVVEFDGDLQQLVERMIRLMQDARGVGLAANQVGILRRVFVIQADENEEPRPLVNPAIVDRSSEVDEDDEGCLSMQGVVVPVERPVRVRIEARDADGNPVALELEGLPARVAQHELDHLDGVLIIDRTTPDGKREAMAVLRQSAAL